MVPIQLHADNPHYLSYHGQPLLLVSSAEHYGAVINRAFDDRRYLDALSSAGMNYTRLFGGSYLEKPGAFGITLNTLAPAEGDFLAPWARTDVPGYINGGGKFDLDAWNEAYFSRLSEFVERAGRRGIIVELTLFSSIYTRDNWEFSPFYPAYNVNATPDLEYKAVNTLDNGGLLARQEAYVRKMVSELNSFDNLIFEIQNEPYIDRPLPAEVLETSAGTQGQDPLTRIDVADAAAMAWQARVAGWIVDTEAGMLKKHLIAQNYTNFCTHIEAVDERVSVLNFHYAWPEAALWNLKFDRVVNFDESGFTGSDDEPYRKQAWRFILAGGGIFNNLDYSFAVGHEDGGAHNEAPGGGSPALRSQLRALREFVTRYDFTSMKPAENLTRGISLLRGERQAIAYLEGQSEGLSIYLPAGRYQVEWLDPIEGNMVASEEVNVTDSLSLSPLVKREELAVSVTQQK
jgi:hypothetical protein